MDLVSITLKLKHHPDRHLEFSDARFALRTIMSCIPNKDKKAMENLHDTQCSQPVVLALFSPTYKRPLLRLTFVHPKGLYYANRLINQWVEHPSLRLGDLDCEIDGIETQLQPWSAIPNWEEIITVSRTFTMEFCTPTVIHSARPLHTPFTGLLPDPLSVFYNIASKWKRLAGPSLPEGLSKYIQMGGCFVSDYEIKTVTIQVLDEYEEVWSKRKVTISPRQYKLKGFIGKVTYVLRERKEGDEDFMAFIFSLARFAFYSGVGQYTRQGMGAVNMWVGNKADA